MRFIISNIYNGSSSMQAWIYENQSGNIAMQVERISQLPKPQQRFVIQVLESVLAQAASR